MALRMGKLSAVKAATDARTTRSRIEALAASSRMVEDLLEPVAEMTEQHRSKIQATLGQLMIGQMAEQVFSDLWFGALGDDELRLRDDRVARTDTDFLVEDRLGRAVFRLNIKFHGATFRNAREMVGLDPDNCFALATYKIHGALEKQVDEHLPYIFVVIGVRGLTAVSVGNLIPSHLTDFVVTTRASARVQGKRRIEEAVVGTVLSRPTDYAIVDDLTRILNQLGSAEWRVISARRADLLLREKLFERAYALRVRGFAQNYRGAELDMHFSVSNDLHPLQDLFDTLRDHGVPGLVSRLERGTL